METQERPNLPKCKELKQALSIENQIELLRSRGLGIDDDLKSQKFLRDNSYYRLDYYFKIIKAGSEKFPDGCSLRSIEALYEFDKFLRNRIFELLEPIELKLKSRISNHLGMNHGSDCFYHPELFIDIPENTEKFTSIQASFEREKKNGKNDPVIKHHESKYLGQYPIWVVVGYLTFSDMSKFYTVLSKQDKKGLVEQLYSIDAYYLESWLFALSILRNICAHFAPLFRREFAICPKLGNLFGWNSFQNKELFAMFLIIKRISSSEDWERFIQGLENLVENNKVVPLVNYGFPSNWREYLLISNQESMVDN